MKDELRANRTEITLNINPLRQGYLRFATLQLNKFTHLNSPCSPTHAWGILHPIENHRHGCPAYFCRILALLVFIRALISWFRPDSYSWPMVTLYDLTDPILTPLRRIIPAFGGLDLTPLLAILILYFVPSVVSSLVHLFVSIIDLKGCFWN